MPSANSFPSIVSIKVSFWKLSNPELMRDGFCFEADILNHDTVDLAIKLKLSERVGVHQANGEYIVEHYDEPNVDARSIAFL